MARLRHRLETQSQQIIFSTDYGLLTTDIIESATGVLLPGYVTEYSTIIERLSHELGLFR
jgi:hypothetical protein